MNIVLVNLCKAGKIYRLANFVAQGETVLGNAIKNDVVNITDFREFVETSTLKEFLVFASTYFNVLDSREEIFFNEIRSNNLSKYHNTYIAPRYYNFKYDKDKVVMVYQSGASLDFAREGGDSIFSSLSNKEIIATGIIPFYYNNKLITPRHMYEIFEAKRDNKVMDLSGLYSAGYYDAQKLKGINKPINTLTDKQVLYIINKILSYGDRKDISEFSSNRKDALGFEMYHYKKDILPIKVIVSKYVNPGYTRKYEYLSCVDCDTLVSHSTLSIRYSAKAVDTKTLDYMDTPLMKALSDFLGISEHTNEFEAFEIIQQHKIMIKQLFAQSKDKATEYLFNNINAPIGFNRLLQAVGILNSSIFAKAFLKSIVQGGVSVPDSVTPDDFYQFDVFLAFYIERLLHLIRRESCVSDSVWYAVCEEEFIVVEDDVDTTDEEEEETEEE